MILHQGHEIYQRGLSPSPQHVLSYEGMISNERSKLLKKRIRKMRQKLRENGADYIYMLEPSDGAKLAIGPIAQTLNTVFQQVHLSRIFRHDNDLTDSVLRDLNRVMETEVFLYI